MRNHGGVRSISTLLCVLFLVFSCAKEGCGANKTTPSTSLPKLKVSGNRIVITNGDAIRLRGVNFNDPFVLDKDDLDNNGVSDRHFDQLETDFERVKAMGANIVRMPIYPGFYFLVGESYLSTYTDPLVALAKKHQIYLVLSYHAIGSPSGYYDPDSDRMLAHLGYTAKLYYSDTDMAIRFWDTIAARYGKEDHVIFEIWNEPVDKTAPLTWSDWRPTGERLISTIRKHSDNLILGPGINYTTDLTGVPGNPYSDTNLAYVAHAYPSTHPSQSESEWETKFGFLSATYPVIITEWGFRKGGDETSGGTIDAFGTPFANYIDKKGLHWIAFIYHPPDAEPPMLESDWVTLNEFGNLVKARLRP